MDHSLIGAVVRRREFITLFAGAAAAGPLPAHAQQPDARVYRIGILWATAAKNSVRLDYFRSGLQELGYAEGTNLVLLDLSGQRVELSAEGWMPAVAELVQKKVDVIVTAGTSATLAVHRAAGSVPVVMTFVSDPVGRGFVASLGRPGGDITGLTNFGPELSAKWLELIKELAPSATRVGVLYDLVLRPVIEGMKKAASTNGITLKLVEVLNDGQLQTWLAASQSPDIDALIVFLPARSAEDQSGILQFAASHRLPAVYWWREYVDAGGLIYYGPSVKEMYRRAAVFVDKILKGAKPAELPVEQPTHLDLVINLKTAKALGLTIPQALLATASEVIE